MSIIQVDSTARTLTFHDRIIACSIGRSGACAAADKREGDGFTPLGAWPLGCVLFRPEHAENIPKTTLAWRWICDQDGWSDDPRDPAYNRPVHLPHPHSAEKLHREDSLYDVVITLQHNDTPPIPNKGSAIFFHVWNNAQPTEGCVAIAREEMDQLLPLLNPGDIMEIH